MWFYIENNKKKGPLTKDGLVLLYKNGTLNDDTKIWRKGMAKWETIADSRRLRLIRFSDLSRRDIAIKKSTSFFRPFLIVDFVLLLLFAYFVFIRLGYLENVYINKDLLLNDIKIDATVLIRMTELVSITIFAFILITMWRASNWIYNIARIAKSKRTLIDTQFGSKFLGYSLIIPFFNLILPFLGMIYLFKVGDECKDKPYTLETFIFLITWWFFFLFSTLLGFYIFFMYPNVDSYNTIKGMLHLDLLAVVCGIVSLALWYILTLKLNGIYFHSMK